MYKHLPILLSAIAALALPGPAPVDATRCRDVSNLVGKKGPKFIGMPESFSLSPGWYPDEEDTKLYRYWDGEGWTEFRKPRIANPAVNHSVLGEYSVGSVSMAEDAAQYYEAEVVVSAREAGDRGVVSRVLSRLWRVVESFPPLLTFMVVITVVIYIVLSAGTLLGLLRYEMYVNDARSDQMRIECESVGGRYHWLHGEGGFSFINASICLGKRP